MTNNDLRIISKLVRQYRNAISCQTSGEHRDAKHGENNPDIKEEDMIELFADLCDYCEINGWNCELIFKRARS